MNATAVNIKPKLQQSNIDKLSSSARQILDVFSGTPELTMAELVRETGKTEITIRKSVQNLVKKGFLTKLGTTRGAFYTIRK